MVQKKSCPQMMGFLAGTWLDLGWEPNSKKLETASEITKLATYAELGSPFSAHFSPVFGISPAFVPSMANLLSSRPFGCLVGSQESKLIEGPSAEKGCWTGLERGVSTAPETSYAEYTPPALSEGRPVRPGGTPAGL